MAKKKKNLQEIIQELKNLYDTDKVKNKEKILHLLDVIKNKYGRELAFGGHTYEIKKDGQTVTVHDNQVIVMWAEIWYDMKHV